MFDLEEYEILMSGFMEFATEKAQYQPSTLTRYKVILDDYFHSNVIDKVERNNYSEIFSRERLSLLRRKSNNVRPSLLRFLYFLYDEKFIEELDYYQLQNNVKSTFGSEEQEKEDSVEFLTPNEIRTLFSDQLTYKYEYEEKMLPLICSLSFFYMFKQEDVIKLTLSDIVLEKQRIRNVRRTEENSDLVEWLSLNDITVKYLKTYLTYRQTLLYPDDALLVMENEPLDNNKINKLFNCFERRDNKVLFGNKKVHQSLLTRSMMLYILISTNGIGLYQILLEQEMNTALDHAFNEYLSIVRTENKNELYDRYNIEEILPKKKRAVDVNVGFYSELNDVNQKDIGDYDMNNNRNLENSKLTIQRMVRDSKISRYLRNQYDNECQLCGYRLRKSNGEYYSEAHHIQPYNKVHRGDDNSNNLIVLCPNCHTQFDDLYYVIHPETQKVHCIFGEDDQYHLEMLAMKEGHILNSKYLEYTWKLFEEKKRTLVSKVVL
ncbi:HNH endonuclease [Peribacillus sp. B-H-3]|uniref:HNH endonuclease n=1 Tax=Peribacillus sp. B-H-3 TaxID=3400420 RepID=UPI003B013134